MTNALKHAFTGRYWGTITLRSLADGEGCRVIVADDGVGLPEGVEWPKPGKLSSLIVRSLRENALFRFCGRVAFRPGHARDHRVYARGCCAGGKRLTPVRAPDGSPRPLLANFIVASEDHHRALYRRAIALGYSAAYLNSGSILRLSLVPPGSTNFLSTSFRLS